MNAVQTYTPSVTAPHFIPPPAGQPVKDSHLGSLLVAMAVAATLILAGYLWAREKEETLLHSVAPEFCDAKLHGVALIREALSRPDTLVFFGSSELIPDVPLKGVDFFSESPTGFSMFPVGKAGTTALSVLQKLGCAGGQLVDRKVVLSLSPSFFQTEEVDAKYFEGNSSRLQLKEFFASNYFSRELKRDVALQILKYPKVYEGDRMLQIALHCYSRPKFLNRVLLWVLAPYAALERGIGRMQDHVEAAFALNGEPELAAMASEFHPRRGRLLKWDELFRAAERQSKELAAKSKRAPIKVTRAHGSWDRQFVAKVQKAQEWKDFELVLRVLNEAGAHPLIISMPLHADVLEAQGVSEEARKEYGVKLRALVNKYRAPLVYFNDHESDPVFFVDQNDHIGSKGWWYYNKVLDDFYHDRLGASSIAAPNPPVNESQP